MRYLETNLPAAGKILGLRRPNLRLATNRERYVGQAQVSMTQQYGLAHERLMHAPGLDMNQAATTNQRAHNGFADVNGNVQFAL